MKKRIAILIAAAMLVTSMPFFAFADDETPAAGGTDQTETTETGGTTEPEVPSGWNDGHT